LTQISFTFLQTSNNDERVIEKRVKEIFEPPASRQDKLLYIPLDDCDLTAENYLSNGFIIIEFVVWSLLSHHRESESSYGAVRKNPEIYLYVTVFNVAL
jgi:hypothetical protein